MTKYYEGGLYLNYYLDASAGLVGCLSAQPIYRWLKIQLSNIVALSMTLFFVMWLFLFQENHVSARWITTLGAP